MDNTVSEELRQFIEIYDFIHVTSNPHYAQSNGLAESTVQVAKGIYRQEDPLLGFDDIQRHAIFPYQSQSCWAVDENSDNFTHFV